MNDKESKRQEISTIDAYKIITNILVANVGGATITEARGIYTHEDGTIVIESTLMCLLYDADDEAITRSIKAIKVALNQESIIREDAEVNSVLV